MIKAVIFDLNGVFIKSKKLSERFEEKFGVSSEKFLKALNSIMPKLRMPGAGNAFSYWQDYFNEWDIELSEKDFLDFWFNGEKEIPEMIELARNLKEKGIKIFVLSNNFLERSNYYKRNFEFLKSIPEKIYFSYQSGLVKPDPEAFLNVLSENNLKPEECIYFDDSATNVSTAHNLGIKSFIFKDANETNKILEDYNL